MDNLATLSTEIAEWARRCAERAETPEFQANAAKLQAEIAAANKQAREADRKLGLLRSGVPACLWAALREPQKTPALDAARYWLSSPPNCVYLALAGPAGRGKTFAASWAVAERGGLYAIAHDLVTRGTFDPVWLDLAAAPLVALDELGAEHRNPAYDASLYTLLGTRHAHRRRTLLATNLDGAAFAARYAPDSTDPLRDRLRTATRWVNLPGESMRTHWAETEREEGTKP
jgi:hypothetical protein